MRTIKFRGKRIKNSEWVYGHYFDCNNGNSFIKQTIDENGVLGNEDFMVSEFTIGQFTGLTDKKGKEIYEGDVVNFKTYDGYDYVGLISYVYSEYHIYVPFYDSRHPLYNNRNGKDIEVIGNIHDNPKLLEVK